MEQDNGVKKVAVAAPAPEEATAMATPCYKKTVGEEATFLETAKDYFAQFKEISAQKHWICLKSYFNEKCGSVLGKQKVEPVVKDEAQEVVAKPVAAVESH